jgi:hypothetical protein
MAEQYRKAGRRAKSEASFQQTKTPGQARAFETNYETAF